jgi:hypothetical protein
LVYNSGWSKNNFEASGMARDNSSGDNNGCEGRSRRPKARPLRSIIRARALVGLLRAQIRSLEQALGEDSNIHPLRFEQLGSLRLTSERLAEAVEEAASARKRERLADESPATADCEQSVWSLGGSGHPAKQVVQLQLVQSHIAALVENGALAPWHTTDLASLQHAAQLMFDRWTGLYTRSTWKSVSRSALSERRSGRDRRGASPLSGYLLKLIADTPLDRRTGGDRRLEAAAARTPAQSCGRLSPPTAWASHSRRVGNVVRFAPSKGPRAAMGEPPSQKPADPLCRAGASYRSNVRGADQVLEVRL